MRYKKKTVLLLFLTLSFSTTAQIEMRGKILDRENNEPIDQATVLLLDKTDRSLVKGGVSNEKGTFYLNGVKEGDFLLQVRFIGYETWEQSITLKTEKSPYRLDTLKIERSSNLLNEVVIQGRVAEVKVNNDTIEYQANAYKLTEGTALEGLLKKMPGVEVDKDGKITIQGKEVKKILVDGKEFFSQDPTVASKNLPANMVERVQAYDKKSDMSRMTGFDDGEDEQVINLVIKPHMKQGWMANAYAGYGNKGRFEGNMMINRMINRDQWSIIAGSNNTNNMSASELSSSSPQSSYGRGGRRGGRGDRGGSGGGVTTSTSLGVNLSKEISPRLTLNGDLSLNNSTNKLIGKDNRQNLLPNNSSSYDISNYENIRTNQNAAANLRLEWAPDTLTQLILTANAGHNVNRADDNYFSHNLNGELDSINATQAFADSKGSEQQLYTRLEMSRRLNNKGRTINGSLHVSLNNGFSNEQNNSTVRYFTTPDSLEEINQQSRYDNHSKSLRLHLAWTEPLSKRSALQASFRLSTGKRTLLRNSFSLDDNGEYSRLDSANSISTLNKTMEYRFNLAYRFTEKRYNYMLGINLDPSLATTTTFVGEHPLNTFERRPINISPMARFRYQIKKETNLNLDYHGRTSQPSIKQLQPRADVTDPLNRITGNPQLSPSYTHNLRFHFFNYINEKQSGLFLMAYGQYAINDIATKTTYDKQRGVRETTYENVSGNYRADMRLTYNTPLKNRRFSINTTSRLSFNRSAGFINDIANSITGHSLHEQAGIRYRTDRSDIALQGNLQYRQTNNTLQKEASTTTFNYGAGLTITQQLPFNLFIESDITYSANSGYAAGFKQHEVLWNAAISHSFMKNKNATIRLKMYDLLQQRSNISYTTENNVIKYSEQNSLTAYFITHFIYRFTLFGGGTTENDMQKEPTGRRDHRGGGGRGGRAL